MDEQKQYNWRFILRAGLLAGIFPLFTAIVGMVEAFDKRGVVDGVLTLGQVVLFAASIIAGYWTAQRLRAKGPLAALAGGLAAGVLSSLPLAALTLLASTVDVSKMFVSINAALLKILTFGQESLLRGVATMMAALIVAGLAGAIFSLLPRLLRAPLTAAIIWTVGAGVMSELLVQIGQQMLDREQMRALFKSGVLRPTTAIWIFAIIFLLSLLWNWQGEALKKKFSGISPQNQRYTRYGGSALLGAALLVAPWLLGSYLSEVMSNIGLYVLMGFGLNIAVGWAGLLDLGYVTNFAVGAYVMAVLTSTGPLGLAARADIGFFNFWLALPISVLAAMLTGFVLALPVLRMRGDYLAITTLGFGEIIRLLALSDWLKPLIGGAQGVLFIPKAKIGSLEFGGPQQLYYLIFAACLLMLYVSLRLNNSRTGRQWMAMREDEDVAGAMGIDIVRTKLLAFTLSAASGGMAGAIFASKLGTIFPHSFNLLISINVLSLIIVGGMGSTPGVVVGAIVLIGLPELLREFSEFRLLMYGALLVIMMLMRPEGFWPSAVTLREIRGDDAVTQETKP